MIDTEDKTNIGVIIFIFSFIEANGLWFTGPHITFMENRIE